MNPPAKGPVVVPNTTKRDTLVAMLIGVVVLGFVGYGVMHMAQPVSGNKLTGTVVEKVFTPLAERQVSFSGRQIKETKEIAGEYVLKVRVDPGGRIYEVPVEQYGYDSQKVGDTMTFLRPPSEQH
jgi:hypothetical protein